MRALIVTGAVLLGVLPQAARAYVISPGAFATFPSAAAGCTLNFVFDGVGDDAGRVFVGTAAHCAGAVGDEMQMGQGAIDPFGSGTTVGTVAARGPYDVPDGNDSVDDDWMLVEILPSFRRDVRPEMLGHPRFPSRVAATSEMRSGDALQFSGHGTLTQATQPTREQRQGVWLGGDEIGYDALAPSVTNGDSGGPIVDVKTGGALGVVSTGYRVFCTPGCTLEGPTITQLIRGAAAQGLAVRLRAAGEPAPAAAPSRPDADSAPAPVPAAPGPAAPKPRLTLSGCVRRGRLTLRVRANVPLAEVRVRGRRYRRGVIRLRGRRVRVVAVTREGARLTVSRSFASC